LVACGYALGFFLVVVLALARQTGLPATQTLWAEDGAIFYSQAVARSVFHTLASSYNGYGQLVPRLAVQLTALGPLRDVSATVALSGALGLASLSCLVFHMARGHIASPSLRAVLVGAMVLLPVAVVEMLDNLVNLPWWIFFAAFWALLWRPSNRRGQLVAALTCLLAAASEPLVGLLLPLAAVRAVALRNAAAAYLGPVVAKTSHAGERVREGDDRAKVRGGGTNWRDNSAAGGLVLGLVYQLAVVVGSNGEHTFSHGGLSSIPAAFGARVGLGWLTGLRATDAVVGWSRPAAEVVGGAVFLAVVVAGLKLGDRRARAFTVAVAVLAPVCFAVPVWLRGAGPYMQAAKSVGYAGRYAATPMLMLISVVLVLAGHLSTGPGKRAAALGAIALCCVLLAPAWVTDFRDRNGRAEGPSWQSRLPLALAECRSKPGLRLVRLVIDPPIDHVVVSCRALERRAVGDV
jgi:hypothetical protein